MGDDQAAPGHGEIRSCGWCGRMVPNEGLICPHCGTELTDMVTVRPGRHGPRVRSRRVFRGRPLPDLGTRWWGRFVDNLIVGLPVSLIVFIAVRQRGPLRFLPAVVITAYETFCLGKWGRTIGKRVAGTRVVPVRAGRPKPSWAQAVIRAVVYASPSLLFLVPGLGGFFALETAPIAIWLPILVERHRRGLPDLLAGTIVVENRPELTASDS